ncbi:hypothetical protein TYRP_009490 [Tyrophagus putrescentiae]|nr:hypothetical protein TYRP_009490 [Tyrophagus putrescentiae]
MLLKIVPHLFSSSSSRPDSRGIFKFNRVLGNVNVNRLADDNLIVEGQHPALLCPQQLIIHPTEAVPGDGRQRGPLYGGHLIVGDLALMANARPVGAIRVTAADVNNFSISQVNGPVTAENAVKLDDISLARPPDRPAVGRGPGQF